MCCYYAVNNTICILCHRMHDKYPVWCKDYKPFCLLAKKLPFGKRNFALKIGNTAHYTCKQCHYTKLAVQVVTRLERKYVLQILYKSTEVN